MSDRGGVRTCTYKGGVGAEIMYTFADMYQYSTSTAIDCNKVYKYCSLPLPLLIFLKNRERAV